MTVRILFTLALKILGIYFLKDIFIALPTLMYTVFDWVKGDYSQAIGSSLYSVFIIGMYALVVYALLFRTDLLMEKLKLTEGFSDQEIPLNVHRSTVLSIAVIMVALLLIVQAVPSLIRTLVQFYMYRETARSLLSGVEPFDYSLIAVYVAEIVLGLLAIGHQRSIVSFIERAQRKNIKS